MKCPTFGLVVVVGFALVAGCSPRISTGGASATGGRGPGGTPGTAGAGTGTGGALGIGGGSSGGLSGSAGAGSGCEGFETTPVGTNVAPAGWTRMGSVDVISDAANVYLGARALRINAAPNGARRIIKTGADITALGGHHWGRIFFKVQTQSAGAGFVAWIDEIALHTDRIGCAN